MARFRIVRDSYCGYAVEKKVWWWPWWFEPRTNTHCSVEAAERYASKVSNPVVKYL